ncbi:MAG: hypothetical protein WCF18_06445 [Chthoniobacteraceae bacterium]
MVQAPVISNGDSPLPGEIVELPVDSEIFGFFVAEYRPNVAALGAGKTGRALSGVREQLETRSLRLISARLPASEHRAIAALADAGFKIVDYALTAHLSRLHRAKLPTAHASLRPARVGDLPRLEQIAETSFQFGRYHTDGEFPRPLANRRYRRWVGHAMRELSESNIMLVLESAGRVAGFMHVGLDHGHAELKLGAVDVALENGLLGYQLYVNTLGHLQAAGVREVSARISAANTAVMNLYAGLGFQFERPEAVFHLHLL